MNAEKLHAIFLQLRNDFKSTNLVGQLKGLVSDLNNQINQPNQPQHQQNFSKNIERIYNALNSSIVNKFQPTWIQTIDEIGAKDLLGKKLKERMELIFARNQITPSIAVKEIQDIHSQVVELESAINNIISGLKKLELKQTN